MARLTFEERNQNNYVKYSDVSIETINKYKGKLPDELLNIWNIMGYGIYENGFIQLVNPDDYDFVFKYIDKLLEPSIVFAIKAMGDLLIWEGNKNWTIAPNEGNRVKIINVSFIAQAFISKGENVSRKLEQEIDDRMVTLYGIHWQESTKDAIRRIEKENKVPQ